MKTNLVTKAVCGVALAALLTCVRAGAQLNTMDAIELLRSTYQTDRQAVVAKVLELNESESSAFWPLYQSYRADMEKIGDSLVKLVLEYSDSYPNVPEDTARRLLKQYMALEKQLVAKRAWYLKRAGKSISANKVLRWAQVENRLDLGLRLRLASTIPFVPTDRAKPGTTP